MPNPVHFRAKRHVHTTLTVSVFKAWQNAVIFRKNIVSEFISWQDKHKNIKHFSLCLRLFWVFLNDQNFDSTLWPKCYENVPNLYNCIIKYYFGHRKGAIIITINVCHFFVKRSWVDRQKLCRTAVFLNLCKLDAFCNPDLLAPRLSRLH